jgi:enoyl-CoA hydratase
VSKVLLEKHGRIARVILNTPDHRNAWEWPRLVEDGLTAQFRAHMDDVADDDDIGVVIISGRGPVFSTGADLTKVGFLYGMGTGQPGERRPSQRVRLRRDRDLLELYKYVLTFPKVTIAQVHGFATGMSFAMISVCDLAVAASDAKLSRVDQRVGLAGNAIDTTNLILTIGMKRALGMLLTGATVSGDEAVEIGLVNAAVPESDLEAEAMALADRVVAMPLDGIVISKAMRIQTYHMLGLLQGLDLHTIGHTLFTNLRWEPGEFNFFRERREGDTKSAWRQRDEHYDSAAEPSAGDST